MAISTFAPSSGAPALHKCRKDPLRQVHAGHDSPTLAPTRTGGPPSGPVIDITPPRACTTMS